MPSELGRKITTHRKAPVEWMVDSNRNLDKLKALYAGDLK